MQALFRTTLPHPLDDHAYASYDVGDGCDMPSLVPGVDLLSERSDFIGVCDEILCLNFNSRRHLIQPLLAVPNVTAHLVNAGIAVLYVIWCETLKCVFVSEVPAKCHVAVHSKAPPTFQSCLCLWYRLCQRHVDTNRDVRMFNRLCHRRQSQNELNQLGSWKLPALWFASLLIDMSSHIEIISAYHISLFCRILCTV